MAAITICSDFGAQKNNSLNFDLQAGTFDVIGLKLNIQKTKIMAPGPITSWEIDGETVAD